MVCSNCGAQNKETAIFCHSCGCDMSPTEFMEDTGSSSLSETPPTVRLRKGGPTLNRGRYEIIKEIASGGMGKIYLAHDNQTKTLVVVKKMLPVAETDEELEYLEKRFHEEGMLLYNLKHHALPRVLDLFTKGQNFYIIMEYIEGENLSQFIKRRPNGRITIEECIYFLDKVLDILHFLHSQNPPVIHRDIKPGNIMINNLGEVVLVDFGLARSFDSESVGTARVGTYGYSSPEHFSGKFKLSSDLYCTGVTFHYLLSGEDPRLRVPFEFPPLSKYRDDVPEGLQLVFNKLLAINPADRFQTAQEVKAALADFQDEQLRAFIETPIPVAESNPSYVVTSIGEASGKFDLKIGEKHTIRNEKPDSNGDSKTSENAKPQLSSSKDAESDQNDNRTVQTEISQNSIGILNGQKKPNGKTSEGTYQSPQKQEPRAAIPLAPQPDVEIRKYDIKPSKQTPPEKGRKKEKPVDATVKEKNSSGDKKLKPDKPIREKKRKSPALTVVLLLLIVAGAAFAVYYLSPETIQRYLPFIYTKASETVKPGFITIETSKTLINGALITVTSKDPNIYGQNGTSTFEGDSLLASANTNQTSDNARPVYIQVPPGIYTVKIARKNCNDLVIREQEIKSGQNFEINQPLTELPDPVIVVKTNVEAEIFIRDIPRGTTSGSGNTLEVPVQADMAFDIVAKKEGYEPAKAGPITMERGSKREFYLNLEEIQSSTPSEEISPSPTATATETIAAPSVTPAESPATASPSPTP